MSKERIEAQGSHVSEVTSQQTLWLLTTRLFSQVLEKINNPHYLYRMTILQAISLLAPVMGAEITCQKLLPVVINSSKDR